MVKYVVVPEVPGGPVGPEMVIVGKDNMGLVVRKGRPRKAQNTERLAEVLRLYFVEKLSMRQIADILGVSHMSIYRMLSDPNVELLI